MAIETHVYVVVRKDIPLAAQVVQACHAAHEAGASFYRPHGGTRFDTQLLAIEEAPRKFGSNLVLLGIDTDEDLLRLAKDLNQAGIRYELFFEPDDQLG